LPTSADLDEAEPSLVFGGTVSARTVAVAQAGIGTHVSATSDTQATSSGRW
jgi:hypothetical protein